MKKNKLLYKIIKYIMWGPVLLSLLAFFSGHVLQRSENNAALNRLILSQGLEPYRKNQLACNNIYDSILTDQGSIVENNILIRDGIKKKWNFSSKHTQ